MNRTARRLRPLDNQNTKRDSAVTLRMVNGDTLANWTGIPENTAENPHCLLYLVALERPAIRSTMARRLHLSDNLAGGDACRNAGILARDPHFWDYLQQINLTAYEAEIDAGRARHFINRVCAVSSRYEFDRKFEAAQRFFTLIEQPFLTWLQIADSD
jgi:hypothetical protein